MEGSVHLEKNNNFGRICFSHPKGNSLPTTLLKKLIDSFQTANEDPEIRVIILESEGKMRFISGKSRFQNWKDTENQ